MFTAESIELPPELLHAVSERRRRVVLVVGAGCSLEYPTGLKLASEYADEVHRQLLRDGLLAEGDCCDSSDLSLLASVVWERCGSQEPIVARLPRAEFRTARPNDGYLIAAALLREGAIDALMTLNFDLAMSSALMDLSADNVDVVAGPHHLRDLGAPAVVYLTEMSKSLIRTAGYSGARRSRTSGATTGRRL